MIKVPKRISLLKRLVSPTVRRASDSDGAYLHTPWPKNSISLSLIAFIIPPIIYVFGDLHTTFNIGTETEFFTKLTQVFVTLYFYLIGALFVNLLLHRRIKVDDNGMQSSVRFIISLMVNYLAVLVPQIVFYEMKLGGYDDSGLSIWAIYPIMASGVVVFLLEGTYFSEEKGTMPYDKGAGVLSNAPYVSPLLGKTGRKGNAQPITKPSRPLLGQELAEKATKTAIAAWVEDDVSAPLSLLFSGPSGVGKTQWAENLAQMYGRRLTQFNMPEYSGGTSTKGGDIAKDKLLGMPSGYIESERGGLLTNALKENPYGIFLFDEMEKASPSLFTVFLNMLDRGFVDDARGNRFDCSKAIFIFTTNVGRDIDPNLSESQMRDKMGRAGFAPELMGRMNKLIQFKPFSIEIAAKITTSELKKEFSRLIKKRGLDMKAPEIVWSSEKVAQRSALDHLGYETYGVRVLQRFAKDTVATVLEEHKEAFKKLVLYPVKHKAPRPAKGEVILPVGRKKIYDTEHLASIMREQVKGQDHAIDTVLEQVEMRELGIIAKPNQPEGTFLLTGPSGTGKTQLVKAIAEATGRKFLRFDMGAFKDSNAINAFFGPPAGYQGADKGGQLTQGVLDFPEAIILLDEIEKANPEIWDAFMSIFDDGSAKDTSSGEVVQFGKTMIFMTSNLITEDVDSETAREIARESGYFRPEMVNRIEHVVSFRPLSDAVKMDIVRAVIARVVDNYNKHNGESLKVDDAWVLNYIEFDMSNGVRDLERQVQKDIFQMVKIRD